MTPVVVVTPMGRVAVLPLLSLTVMVAVPPPTAVTVKVALPEPVASRRRKFAWMLGGFTVATAVFDDEAVKTPVYDASLTVNWAVDVAPIREMLVAPPGTETAMLAPLLPVPPPMTGTPTKGPIAPEPHAERPRLLKRAPIQRDGRA
jgi:hypothetical protein